MLVSFTCNVCDKRMVEEQEFTGVFINSFCNGPMICSECRKKMKKESTVKLDPLRGCQTWICDSCRRPVMTVNGKEDGVKLRYFNPDFRNLGEKVLCLDCSDKIVKNMHCAPTENEKMKPKRTSEPMNNYYLRELLGETAFERLISLQCDLCGDKANLQNIDLTELRFVTNLPEDVELVQSLGWRITKHKRICPTCLRQLLRDKTIHEGLLKDINEMLKGD